MKMIQQIKRSSNWMLALTVLLAMALTGCGGGGGSSSGNADTGNNVAFVLTSAYPTGNYSTIDLDTLTASINLGAPGAAESDTAGAYYNGRIYIINRGTPSNITILDKEAPSDVLNQFSTGNNSNPYAMVFKSDTEAYVCLYGSNELLVVDPTAATDQITDTIDLSGFMAAGDTANVEAAIMVKVNDFLFVALQRLNGYAVENDALLVVIDTTTNEVVDVDVSTPALDAITLTGRNPQYMVYNEVAGKIFISETGNYSANDGGIEAVDPVSWEAEGFVISEATLAGDVGPVAMVDDTLGYVVVGGFAPNKVVSFDAGSGEQTADLLTDVPFIPSLTLDAQGRLFVPDTTTTAPGVRIYDTSSDTEITSGAIDVGLPPNVILVY